MPEHKGEAGNAFGAFFGGGGARERDEIGAGVGDESKVEDDGGVDKRGGGGGGEKKG